MVCHGKVHVLDGIEVLDRLGADSGIINLYPVIVFIKRKHDPVRASLIFLTPDHKLERAVLLLEEEVMNGVRFVPYAVGKCGRIIYGLVVRKDCSEVVKVVRGDSRLVVPSEKSVCLVAGLVHAVTENVH